MKELLGKEVNIDGRQGEISNICGCSYEVTFFNLNDGKAFVYAKDIEKYLSPSIASDEELEQAYARIEEIDRELSNEYESYGETVWASQLECERERLEDKICEYEGSRPSVN